MNNVNLVNSGDLSPRKRKAAILLADGQQVNKVAKDLEVSIESIRLWKKEKAFQIYFRNLLSLIEKDAVEHLRSRNMFAANTITDLMGADQPPQVRLKAATEVLTFNRLQKRSEDFYHSMENGSVASKIIKHQSMVAMTQTLLGFISPNTDIFPAGETKAIDIPSSGN